MSAYWKDVFREITNTKGRFLLLVIISVLGAASIVGLQAAAIDMRAVADKTYKERNLYDIQIKSTVGFNEDDINVLRNIDGVKTVMPSYIIDVYAYFNNTGYTVRTYSLPGELNQIELLEGRFPENSRECLVEPRFLNMSHLNIGDKIFLGLDDMDDFYNAIENNELTITGVAISPLYVNVTERGQTNLGNGRLDFYIYLHPSAYLFDVYTDVYVQMRDSLNIDNLTDAYNDIAVKWKEKIITAGEARIPVKLDELDSARNELNDGFREYHDGVRELEEKLAKGQKELNEAEETLNSVNLDELFEDGARQLEEARILLDSAKKELEESQATLDRNRRMLRAARYNAYQEEINNGWEEYYAGLQEYENGVAEFEREKADAVKQLEDARLEIESGRAQLERERADAVKQLEDALLELEDAKEQLESAPDPEWFYFTRKDGVAFERYYQDTLRLEKIGYVFPLVFLLVAILVSVTTMTRMVEVHRIQIGIYKALGYKSFSIMFKYLIYALSVGIIGGVAGVFAGSFSFPKIITTAYAYLYDMPPVSTSVPYSIGAVSVTAAVFTVTLATFAAFLRTSRDVPSRLMRPKSPKAGKRVLLERIPFIWKRFGFIGKVTARNIFRYKRRFFMSFIGIAGCTALLLTAFGLRDSVKGVVIIQFDKIFKYDAIVYLKDITTPQQRTELDSILKDDAQQSRHLYIREESVNINGFDVSIIVPENPGNLTEFISLASPVTGKEAAFDLAGSGIILTEKLAKSIEAEPGSSVTINLDGRDYSVNVADITENYFLNYAYMPPDVYSKIFGQQAVINGIFIVSDNLHALAPNLLANNNVRAFIDKDDFMAPIYESTDALGVVIVLLITLACALALVVLFNLSNINISERIRELATIKVLGFYDSEISLYINRENIAVTVMGIILGLIGGIFLHGFVLDAIEVDMLMFPRLVYPVSYLLSALLSIIFAVFVNLIMNFKLTAIDMVGSLKSVE